MDNCKTCLKETMCAGAHKIRSQDCDYYLVNKSKTGTSCKKCGVFNSPDDICINCGFENEKEKQYKTCIRCGNLFNSKGDCCEICGFYGDVD